MDRFTRQPAMKLVRQIATGFKALRWIASEAFEAKGDQILGGADTAFHFRDGDVDGANLEDDFRQVPLNGSLIEQLFIEHHPPAPQVGATIRDVRLARGLFRAHVGRCSHQ